jgi:hypothetical protein
MRWDSQYPLETDGPRIQTSPWGGVLVAKYPASAKSTSLISHEGTGIPTAPYWKNSGVRIVESLRIIVSGRMVDGGRGDVR